MSLQQKNCSQHRIREHASCNRIYSVYVYDCSNFQVFETVPCMQWISAHSSKIWLQKMRGQLHLLQSEAGAPSPETAASGLERKSSPLCCPAL